MGLPGKDPRMTDLSHPNNSCCTRKRLCLVTVPCVLTCHLSEVAHYAGGTRFTRSPNLGTLRQRHKLRSRDFAEVKEEEKKEEGGDEGEG